MKYRVKNLVGAKWHIVVALTALVGCSKHESGQSLENRDEALRKEGFEPREHVSAPTIQVARFVPLEVSLPSELMSLPTEKVIESAYQRVQAALTQGITDPSPRNAEIRVRIVKLWNSFVPEFSTKPISGASVEVLSGLRLPDEITDLLVTNANFGELLKANKVPFLTSEEELYQAATIYAMARIIGFTAGDEITMLLRERHNQPPSVGDMVAYFSISDAIRELGGGNTRAPVVEDLGAESSARNPVYRLLAVQAIAAALPAGVSEYPIENDDKAIAVYRARAIALSNFLNDTDPTIIRKLIETLSSLPVDEARQTLEVLRDRYPSGFSHNVGKH
ncbi:MAG: hypothetical protein QM790_18925 [Nibricoccus sp.]